MVPSDPSPADNGGPNKIGRRRFICTVAGGAAFAIGGNLLQRGAAQPQPEENPAIGRWDVLGLSGVVGMKAALLHTNCVLFFARPEQEEPHERINTNDNGLPGAGIADGTTTRPLSTIFPLSGPAAYKPQIVQIEYNPFCSGLTFLEDGRLLVAGGDRKDNVSADQSFPNVPPNTKYGLNSLRTFTADEVGRGSWSSIGNISDNRWYPTCTTLPDGRVFIISGSINDQQPHNNQNPTFELIPPLPSGPSYHQFLSDAWPYHSYPFVCPLPDGESMFVFVNRTAHFINTKTWAVTEGPAIGAAMEPAKHYPNMGTVVLLPLLPERNYAAEVMVIGGGGKNVYVQWESEAVATPDIDAVNTCFRLDTTRPEQGWTSAASMELRRVMPDGVLLPDGTVLVVNGAKKGFAGGDRGTGPTRPKNAALAAEIYDPKQNRWRTLAASTIPRLYHSTALLLPDARVLVAGSDHQVSQANYSQHDWDTRECGRSYEYRVEAFSPPYLDGPAANRPKIRKVPNRICYKAKFEVEVESLALQDAADFSACLIRPGAVTHSNNMTQRYVGLKVVEIGGNKISLEAPPSPAIAPPGYYMLFVKNGGIPSEGRFIRLHPDYIAEAAADGIPSDQLVAWFKSDTGVLTDADGRVNSWADCSGMDHDLISISSSVPQRLPTLVRSGINGRPAIRFTVSHLLEDGGYLESRDGRFTGNVGADSYSIFVVLDAWPGGTLGYGGIVGFGDFANKNVQGAVGFRLGPGPLDGNLPRKPGFASLVTAWNWTGSGVHLGSDEDMLVRLGKPSLLETAFDGTKWVMRHNGNDLSAPVPVTGKNTQPGPLTIGRTGAPRVRNSDAGQYFRGDIAEAVIYRKPLSDAERGKIESYLAKKYHLW